VGFNCAGVEIRDRMYIVFAPMYVGIFDIQHYLLSDALFCQPCVTVADQTKPGANPTKHAFSNFTHTC
jgi:hypothetical protein